MNETYLATFDNGDEAALKPLSKDELGQYGFPITEVFASDLSEELGFGVIPVTGYRRDQKLGLCSAMDWKHGATPAFQSNADCDNDLARDTASQMVAITTFTGNADRHGNNWLIDDKTGEIYAIDNGFSCAIEVIGYDPFNDNDPEGRAERGYEDRMRCRKDRIGTVHIPGWRIKPEHLKACEDFMADDAKVDEILKRHFGTDDMVETIKGFMKIVPNSKKYPYYNKSDEEIKEIAVARAKRQLEAGLKVLRDKFDEQKNW